MKRIILFILVLISFNVSAQMSADSISTKVFIENEYLLIDTFTKISSGNVDTLMYSEIMQKKDLPFTRRQMILIPNNDTIYIDSTMILAPYNDTIYRVVNYIPPLIIPNNDTIYKLTNNYRLDYLRSLKIVRYRQVRKYVMDNKEKPENLKMSDLVRKRYQLNYDIDLFWEHPKVKDIIE